MPQTKYLYRLKLTEKDEEGNTLYEGKYKSNDDLIEKDGFKYCIFNRNTIYRIMNKYTKESHQNIVIERIREVIPHRIEKRIVFLTE